VNDGHTPASDEPWIFARADTRREAHALRRWQVQRQDEDTRIKWRVRWMPTEDWPEYPWAVVGYGWYEPMADAIDEDGVVQQQPEQQSSEFPWQ
jgi:hypothetical protein